MSVKSDIEEYFKDVGYVIEANSDERFLLYLTYHAHADVVGHGKIKSWDNQFIGRGVTLDVVGRGKKARPINIEIGYLMLDGLKVACWSPTSQLVDYALIGKWLEPRIAHIVDHDGKPAQTDVANFGEIVHEIYWRQGGR
jgi:hypothetical protein